MLALDFYKDSFEQAFLDETSDFFAKNAEVTFAELNLPSYMLYVDKILEREAERLRLCLDLSTRDKLIVILDKTLIAKFMGDVLQEPPEIDVQASLEGNFVQQEDVEQNEFDSLVKN